MSRRNMMPFSAVVGMDTAKKAVMCMLVSPGIRSILIEGASGTAKTVLARSIECVSGRTLVNIPANSGEEQIFGCIDIERTILAGSVAKMPGLLHRADGGIAYIDDVNLMDAKMLTQIQDSVSRRETVLEREGMSERTSCDIMLTATMNIEEGELPPAVLDRFDMFVHSSVSETPEEREEVLRRNADFKNDPERFAERYRNEEDDIQKKLNKAREIVPLVSVPDELTELIAELCMRLGCRGHRGEITMVHTSISLAALNGRDEVIRKDVEEAAEMCLIHRRTQSPPPPPSPPQREGEQEQQNGERNGERNDDRGTNEEHAEDPPHGDSGGREKEEKEDSRTLPSAEDLVFSVGEAFRVIDYIGKRKAKERTKSRNGRRMVSEIEGRSGRYVRSAVSDDLADIAFDATVRAAAPYQNDRCRNGMTVVIEPSDVRKKVRERRCGCTILFLVDASGSLGVRKRMAAVKGAILSMLRDSYVRRDHIGMMAFRRNETELILPPTRSVEYGYRRLEELPTGGKTPLSKALTDAERFMSSYSRIHAKERCYIVLITDGRANVPMNEGRDANAEAADIAESIHIPGVSWIVVDAGSGRMRFDNAARLAECLGGEYFRLDDLNADALAGMIGNITG